MRHLIVGASAAGLAAAEALLEVDPASDVTLLSEETEAPYCRPLLSYWLSGETPEDLFALPSGALGRAARRLGQQARTLDPGGRKLTLASGQTLSYDRLLLATGAASARLGVEGEDLPNVRGFRTRQDVRVLDAEVRGGARRAVVLGGGLVGVKAACALAARGLEAVLCVSSGHPLSQVVDEAAGELVAEALGAEGVELRRGHSPAAIEAEGGRAAGVRFAAGQHLPCDLVVVGKGVAPRTELTAGFGAATPGGTPVDAALRTALPDVWAAGDCALALDAAWGRPRLNALWPLATEQGALAGRNMAGAGETYGGGIAMNSVRVGTLALVSAGITRPPDSSYSVRSVLERRRGFYRKIVLREGRVVGAICVGATHQAGLLVSAVRRGARLDELPYDPLDEGIHWGRHAFAAGTPERVASQHTGVPASQRPSALGGSP